jgi:hypothetical protein
MQLSLPPLQQKSTGFAAVLVTSTASLPSDFQLQSNSDLTSQRREAQSVLILFVEKVSDTHEQSCVALHSIRRRNINSRVSGIVLTCS